MNSLTALNEIILKISRFNKKFRAQILFKTKPLRSFFIQNYYWLIDLEVYTPFYTSFSCIPNADTKITIAFGIVEANKLITAQKLDQIIHQFLISDLPLKK